VGGVAQDGGESVVADAVVAAESAERSVDVGSSETANGCGRRVVVEGVVSAAGRRAVGSSVEANGCGRSVGGVANDGGKIAADAVVDAVVDVVVEVVVDAAASAAKEQRDLKKKKKMMIIMLAAAVVQIPF